MLVALAGRLRWSSRTSATIALLPTGGSGHRYSIRPRPVRHDVEDLPARVLPVSLLGGVTVAAIETMLADAEFVAVRNGPNWTVVDVCEPPGKVVTHAHDCEGRAEPESPRWNCDATSSPLQDIRRRGRKKIRGLRPRCYSRTLMRVKRVDGSGQTLRLPRLCDKALPVGGMAECDGCVRSTSTPLATYGATADEIAEAASSALATLNALDSGSHGGV
jgi:hypothetical protein